MATEVTVMRYRDFLEEAYQAIRAQAPPVWQLVAMPEWVRSIGELLLHMPPELQREWADQYATLLMKLPAASCGVSQN